MTVELGLAALVFLTAVCPSAPSARAPPRAATYRSWLRKALWVMALLLIGQSALSAWG